MHVALLGATGNVGSRLLQELVQRGHSVTAVARHADRVPALPGVTAQRGDVQDGASLSRTLAGHDAVITALRFQGSDPHALHAAIRAAQVSRWLVVGGAGSLYVADGVQLVDTPDFPAAYKDEALRGREFLAALRTFDDLDWTFLSPAALLLPGVRTGKFRLGADSLLVDAQGNSSISIEDYAVALVDELEKPAHVRQRFTVGY